MVLVPWIRCDVMMMLWKIWKGTKAKDDDDHISSRQKSYLLNHSKSFVRLFIFLRTHEVRVVSWLSTWWSSLPNTHVAGPSICSAGILSHLTFQNWHPPRTRIFWSSSIAAFAFYLLFIIFVSTTTCWTDTSLRTTMRISFLLFLGLLTSAEAFQAHQAIHSSTRTLSSAPLSAYIDINERAGRDVGAMDEWATMCEVQRAPGFQLTTEDGMDYSAMTTADIPEGSPILCVPGNMIISTSSVKAEYGPQSAAVDTLVRYGSGDQAGKFFLFLKIIAEYEQGDQSPYFPWLNSLPRLYFNAISMTGE